MSKEKDKESALGGISSELISAILQFAIKFGIDATIAFLKNRGASIDDAIVALEIASAKSLDQYKAEDAAGRTTPPTQ